MPIEVISLFSISSILRSAASEGSMRAGRFAAEVDCTSMAAPADQKVATEVQ
ncbi:hypothetical protein [uncultured Parolsenella sp.]|uniref:hypothetical protein n=1 Tax=uncultured Parolsenella sp. TaxID=2083008 RepID=UPI0025CD34D9|nr:hypothetical protein [uncultured Parolsenella sp.]